MKLVVPRVGTLDAADSNLLRLAGFLGAECEELFLPPDVAQPEQFLENSLSRESCFVVNPETFGKWLRGQTLSATLAACLARQVKFVLIYNLRVSVFADAVVRAFSENQLQSVQAAPSWADYEISSQATQLCGAFSGLSFGPSNPLNDSVLLGPGAETPILSQISIGGKPFLARKKSDTTEVFFLAGAKVADLEADIWATPLCKFFSQVLPPAMVLRYICGEECWQPNAAQATLIVDDPLLRKDYGFLNFARQLELMDQHNFHTSVAFIPYNCRRTSPATAQLFRERPDRLSICFHGNDHTDAEFATSDPNLLTAMLHEAERRMHSHGKETGISCDRVMVFPQGKFSLAAMKVLKAHHFCAAVNTEVGVADEPARLALADAISPSVLKYEGFPLFLRKYVRNFSSEDIAFNAFFGKPVFIVEHHEIFKNPEVLTDLIARINFLLPGIRWTNLQTALENSSFKRRSPDGSYRIRAYSSVCLVDNPADTTIEGCVEWPGQAGFCRENVGVEAQTGLASQAEGQSSAVCFTLAAGQSRKFSSVCHNEFGHFQVNHKVSSEVKAFLRRRLSELRDNHLSKTPRVLALAESLNRRLLKGPRSSHPAARD